MQYTIRIEDPATPDVLALLEDGERYGAALYPAESNHFLPFEALRAQNIRFVVARDDYQSAIGTGAVALYGDWAELKRMWVVPGCRGKGLSRRLLGALEMIALEAGVSTLRLETGIDNAEALGLYERTGFTRCEPFADYKPDQLSVFMEKQMRKEPAVNGLAAIPPP